MLYRYIYKGIILLVIELSFWYTYPSVQGLFTIVKE